jgi:predicted AAA+ superfamily ATPase
VHPMRLTDTSVKVDAYLRMGGLPVITSVADKRQALVDLFNQCLFKDILQRSEVRDVDKLTAIAVYLVASSSRQVSATRLKGLLSRSVDQARGFLSGRSSCVTWPRRLFSTSC